MVNLKESKNKIVNISLFLVRIAIGWHFLYEGIVKIYTPSWSAYGYLMDSRWIFSDVFKWMAETPAILKLVNIVNVWGLIIIGLLLMFGVFTRFAAAFGVALLSMYYLAYPPFMGSDYGVVAEGHYLLVNKNLIELLMLVVFIVYPPKNVFGLDRLWGEIKEWKNNNLPEGSKVEKTVELENTNIRREFIKNLLPLPIFGVFVISSLKKRGWLSYEEKFLVNKPDASSGATDKAFDYSTLKELKGESPKTKIGNLEVSRLIMGGNLIGGWSHARDLLYASNLVKAYHTDERIIKTLQLAESCGVNSIITNPLLSRTMIKYWHETGGKMQFISDCGGHDSFEEGIRASEKAGASAMYSHGGMTDFMVRDGKFDEIAKGLELIRSFGKPAGIGAHRIESIKALVNYGIKPDFWMKTIHDHDYWSAQVDPVKRDVLDPEFKDNIFCFKPQETVEFMNQLDEPWIGFKILAAGAIKPDVGFKYAFENGADFVAVGMYDFQIVDDVNLTLDVLKSNEVKNRQRRWLV